MPAKGEAMRGKVMHAKFEGPGVLFFASDNDDAEPMRGSAHILMMRDRGQTELLFERMARGGRVTTALGIQPWGDYYGKLSRIDFGVQWMLNCVLSCYWGRRPRPADWPAEEQVNPNAFQLVPRGGMRVKVQRLFSQRGISFNRDTVMSTEVLIGDGEAARLMPHPLRAAILGELHARPFTPIAVPSRILHFAFDTSGARAQIDRANLVAFCHSRGLPPPAAAEKHHRAPFGTTILRWEQHSEFTTYTWEMPADPGGIPFHPDAASLATPMRLVPQPGPLLVAVDLHLLAEDAPRTAPERLFDHASLAVAENSDGAAVYATDFQPGPPASCGFWWPTAACRAERAGALVQRVIEARNLSHAGAARPAGSAAARAFDRGLRAAAGRGHRADAPRRRSRQQSQAARRVDGAGRGGRGRRRRERISLRRQPRL